VESIKFVHTSDLHLDCPFKGVANVDETLQKKLCEATYKTFNNIIDVCLLNQVDFLLISGDIFNAKDKSLKAQINSINRLKRLEKDGIKVFIIHGNHDPLNGWSASLSWPSNVYIFRGETVNKIELKNIGKDAEVLGMSYL
jgi:DNA repair exonuclease SbcCD nuclease subunit